MFAGAVGEIAAVLGDVSVSEYGPAGLLTVLAALVSLFIRNMLQDRGAGYTLADERQEENTALRDQNELLRREISEQRTLKHQAINDLTVAQITLDTIRRLTPNCTCGALAPLGQLLDRRDDTR